jgi:hypothetical protein
MRDKLTSDVNECQGTEYILRSANRCADVEPLARSDDQGTLMYSHDRQRENLPLRHASL